MLELHLRDTLGVLEGQIRECLMVHDKGLYCRTEVVPWGCNLICDLRGHIPLITPCGTKAVRKNAEIEHHAAWREYIAVENLKEIANGKISSLWLFDVVWEKFRIQEKKIEF